MKVSWTMVFPTTQGVLFMETRVVLVQGGGYLIWARGIGNLLRR